MRHTLSIHVENKPGALARISNTFARRGFNIESLVVSPGVEDRFSRMTITCSGRKDDLLQVVKQVAKLPVVRGKPLLGYDIVSSPAGAKLVVNEDEAHIVRSIFGLYLEHQALIPVVAISPVPTRSEAPFEVPTESVYACAPGTAYQANGWAGSTPCAPFTGLMKREAVIAAAENEMSWKLHALFDCRPRN